MEKDELDREILKKVPKEEYRKTTHIVDAIPNKFFSVDAIGNISISNTRSKVRYRLYKLEEAGCVTSKKNYPHRLWKKS